MLIDYAICRHFTLLTLLMPPRRAASALDCRALMIFFDIDICRQSPYFLMPWLIRLRHTLLSIIFAAICHFLISPFADYFSPRYYTDDAMLLDIAAKVERVMMLLAICPMQLMPLATLALCA